MPVLNILCPRQTGPYQLFSTLKQDIHVKKIKRGNGFHCIIHISAICIMSLDREKSDFCMTSWMQCQPQFIYQKTDLYYRKTRLH